MSALIAHMVLNNIRVGITLQCMPLMSGLPPVDKFDFFRSERVCNMLVFAIGFFEAGMLLLQLFFTGSSKQDSFFSSFRFSRVSRLISCSFKARRLSLKDSSLRRVFFCFATREYLLRREFSSLYKAERTKGMSCNFSSTVQR